MVAALGARVGLATGLPASSRRRQDGQPATVVDDLPGERAVLRRWRHDGSGVCARSARHAGDDRSGGLSEGRARAGRAERRAADSGAAGASRPSRSSTQATCSARVDEIDLGAAARRGRFRLALSIAGGADSRRPRNQAGSPDAADRSARTADGAAHQPGTGVLNGDWGLGTGGGERWPGGRMVRDWRRVSGCCCVWLCASASGGDHRSRAGDSAGRDHHAVRRAGALDLGLVDGQPGGDRIAAALSALIDRCLMLNEVRRVMPPEPSPSAVEDRVARMRDAVRLAGGVLARARGERHRRERPAESTPPTICGSAYLDERFSARGPADRRRSRSSVDGPASAAARDERRRR